MAVRYCVVSEDKKSFISYKNGKPTITNKIDEAHRFKKADTARNFLKSNSKGLGMSNSRWVMILESELRRELVKEDSSVAVSPLPPIIDLTDRNIPANMNTTLFPDEVDSIEEMMSTIVSMTSALKAVSEKIPAAMAATDADVQNILHEIELSADLNASDGYKMYVKLRTALRRRRRVKDSADYLTSMKNGDITSITDELAKDIKRLKKPKHYTPRFVDNTLFNT